MVAAERSQMTHRNSPAPVPLITCLAGYLVALDPERGTELWSHALDRSLGRVLHAGGTLFVATRSPGIGHSSNLLAFDARTGALRSDTSLGFQVTAALARADRVYFSGPDGLVALTAEGAILFRHLRELREKSAWNGDQYDVVTFDGRGVELARKPERPEPIRDGMLVLGELSSQPDFDT